MRLENILCQVKSYDATFRKDVSFE